ncbi:MAG: GreA/GreB family elongation factor [Desulfuromonadales bacterium]|nr:GreA/GreB family elongation factor [Desulfuromonadales bacterium]
MTTKTHILKLIIEQLTHDLAVQFGAAKTAHAASIHEENIPDNKYDTLGLEASYVAQGQANRAQDIKQALQIYGRLSLQHFDENSAIRLTALVSLECDDGTTKTVFIGPLEGGLKVRDHQTEIMVITPASPLGRQLIGRVTGDCIAVGSGSSRREYEIIKVC